MKFMLQADRWLGLVCKLSAVEAGALAGRLHIAEPRCHVVDADLGGQPRPMTTAEAREFDAAYREAA